MPTTFEFSPVKLVYGGEALGFHDGRTVLVSRVLPGERAEVEEVRQQKGVVHARPLRILEPSPQRIDPACPYFASCGGCQYQHIDPHAQTAAKVDILRETLRRLGGVKWESPIPAHAGPAWNYRNQAQFKIAAGPDGAPALGFFEAESNRLVPIDACPILSPRLNAVLNMVRGSAWKTTLAQARELELLTDDGDDKMMVTWAGAWSRQEAEALAERCLAEIGGVATVAITCQAGLRVWGEPFLRYQVGDFTYRVSPTAFFQTSRFLLPEFVQSVIAPAGEVPSGDWAIDLYAGVGLFSLPLAQQFESVTAVEALPAAAADLAFNVKSVPGGKVRAVSGDASDYLRRCARREPDLVIMDPPRAGVGIAALKLLLALAPRRLRYVSCSPPTLGRDLGFLLRHDYELESLEMFDFFPQTYHIESLARLRRQS